MPSSSIHIGRRTFVAGLGALSVTPFAFADTRETLPGGGAVSIPSPYKTKTSYPNPAQPDWDVRLAYRNWRSTMSGHPECDGVLGVGRNDRFDTLRSFVSSCRAGLSNGWSFADEIPGQRWGEGETKRYQPVESDSPDGRELIQQLAVHRVGWLDVYDQPSHLYAVRHKAGISVAVFLYDKHGGVSGARKLAARIVKSYAG